MASCTISNFHWSRLSIRTLWNVVVLFSLASCILVFIEFHKHRPQWKSKDIKLPDDKHWTSKQPSSSLHFGVYGATIDTSYSVSILVKSILIETADPVHFHVITDKTSHLVFRTLLKTWNIRHWNYSFYITQKSGVDFIFDPAFLTGLHQNVNEMIFFDPRVHVLNLVNLRNLFSHFDGTRVLGLVDPRSGTDQQPRVVFLNLSNLSRVQWNWKMLTVGLNKFSFLVQEIPCIWEYSSDLSGEMMTCNGESILYRSKTDLTCAACDSISVRDGFELGRDDFDEDWISDQLEKDFLDCGQLMRLVRKSPKRCHPFYYPYNVSEVSEAIVTLVTQLTADRFRMLENIVKVWPGPISVAIYANDTQAHEIYKSVRASEHFKRRRNIAFHMVHSRIDLALYPVNYMRNVAMNYTHTEYLFIDDVDFVPGADTYYDIVRYLKMPKAVEKLEKIVYVVAAFETWRYNLSEGITKLKLLQLWRRKVITPFRQELTWFHKPTNYEVWRTAADAYPVKWQRNYEPYVVIKKSDTPIFDERFVGYNWNKIIYEDHLKLLGFKLMVLPDAFILHHPHDLTTAYNFQEFKKCLDKLYEKARKELQYQQLYGKIFPNS